MTTLLPLIADEQRGVVDLEREVKQLFDKYKAHPVYTIFLPKRVKFELYEVPQKGAIHYIQSLSGNTLDYHEQKIGANIVFVGFDVQSSDYAIMEQDFTFVLDSYALH